MPEQSGSSPHTRGAQEARRPRRRESRIIPAYAGSTCTSRRLGARRWDHPRIRGEHVIPSRNVNGVTGSSPHTRGALRAEPSRRPDVRIIPAYAGSTQRRIPLPRGLRDHPRIRGEHGHDETHFRGDLGSSPHTRGAHLLQPLRACDHGIIPAYAGSTGPPTPVNSASRDHPRIRGEHVVLQSGALVELGIIPAYAGSTRSVGRRRTGWTDHPRIRGEHLEREIPLGIVPGSSPHTRGAPPRGRRGHLCGRIIPAYAGSTDREHSTPSTRADHPRIRGEHVIFRDDQAPSKGSPPHTRGALSPCRTRHAVTRIIPAYAGSTQVGTEGGARMSDHPRIRGEHVTKAASAG